MTRDFAKQQLARIQSWWPSLPASSQAVDEFMRALNWATDAEVEGGISDVIDTHPEGSAPKITHIKTAVKARRPRTYDTATEEERDLYFPGERARRQALELQETERLATWCASNPEAQARYEQHMTALLQDWPPERVQMGRRALHASIVHRVHEEFHAQPLRRVK